MAEIAVAIGTAATTAAATTAGQAVIQAGISIGLSYLARRLMPSPRTPGGTTLSLKTENSDPREIAFGLCASAGSLKYFHTYGPNKNDYLQLDIQLADHECESLEAILVEGVRCELGEEEDDEDVPVTGRQVVGYEGRMWARFHSGGAAQAADPDQVAQNVDYSADAIGVGICRVSVTLKADQKKFKTGLPRLAFIFKGAKLYDWRKDPSEGGAGSPGHTWGDPTTYEWTDNPVVCLYNYRRGIFGGGQRLGGMATPALAMPVSDWTAAANVCEEDVGLKGGGTEPRYRLGGIVPVNSEHASVIREMLAAMAGVEVDSGGSFRPLPGAAQAPVMAIADTDLISTADVEIVPKLSRSVLINSLFGTIADLTQGFEPVALPPRISTADVDTDGAELSEHYDLKMVQSGTQGQRVLEILRRKGRYQRRVTCTLRSRFAVLESGDWVTWTSARYGWTNMTFEVLQATLNRDLTVTVELREIAAAAFAWNPVVDELDPADPAAVDAGGSDLTTVQAFAIANITIAGIGATTRPALRATWSPITDTTVREVLIQFRKVGDLVAAEKTALVPLDGELTWLEGVQGGVTYEARAMPITIPERATTWTAWVSTGSGASAHVVDVSGIANAVPPNTITPEMLSAQARFELALVTAVDSVMGSVAEQVRNTIEQAQAAAEAAIAAMAGGETNRFSIVEINEVVAGVSARWGIAITDQGDVIGLVQLDGSNQGSNFTVVADKFVVAQRGTPGGDPVPVFAIAEVDGVAKLVFRGDMVADGTILARHLDVETLTAISANFGEATVEGLLQSANGNMEIDFNNGSIRILATTSPASP